MQCPPYWVADEVRRTHRLAPLTRPDDARKRGVGAFQPPDEPANGSRSQCRTWRVYVASRQSHGRPMCQSLQTWLGPAGQRGQDGGATTLVPFVHHGQACPPNRDAFSHGPTNRPELFLL